MPASVRCGDSFSGSLSKFIEEYTSKMMLDERAMKRAHESVVDASSRSPTLIVRRFGRHRQAAKKERSSDGKVSFVTGDNEPVVWFWREHFHDRKPADLVRLIEGQEITISMAPGEGEKLGDWKLWGSGDAPKPAERWRGVRGGRWKLCHIFQAAPKHLDDSGEHIKARFIRNFHPINHFWFASEYKWSGDGAYEMQPHPRLGEWPPLCLGLWDFFASRYPEEALWFRANALVDDSEIDEVTRRRLASFSFEWRSSAHSSPGTPPPSADDGPFVVKENSSGRFHFERFGSSTGGPKRDRRFVIVVKDIAGRILRSSLPHTAEELGIAAKGTKDYEADNYRLTDFVRMNEDGDVVPNCALALRVEWRDRPN